jgi:hypothetical protein
MNEKRNVGQYYNEKFHYICRIYYISLLEKWIYVIPRAMLLRSDGQTTQRLYRETWWGNFSIGEPILNHTPSEWDLRFSLLSKSISLTSRLWHPVLWVHLFGGTSITSLVFKVTWRWRQYAPYKRWFISSRLIITVREYIFITYVLLEVKISWYFHDPWKVITEKTLQAVAVRWDRAPWWSCGLKYICCIRPWW